MQCASSGRNTHKRNTGGFSSLTRGMRSMRRTGHPRYEMSGTSGLVARSLHSTAADTGPHWWYRTPGMGQANPCIARSL